MALPILTKVEFNLNKTLREQNIVDKTKPISSQTLPFSNKYTEFRRWSIQFQ